MNIRPFEWRDLPALHRYRDQCVFLDNVMILTSGPIYAPARVVFSALSHALGVFTYLRVDQEGDPAVFFGQVRHTAGGSSAHLSFFTPQSNLEISGFPEMIELMTGQVGERGALHILAEVDEQTVVFDLLRQAGFGVYARQRIWKLPDTPSPDGLPELRRAILSHDQASVKFLYVNLVPGLVQQFEPPPFGQLHGLVYYKGNELLAYVEVRHGPRGVWIQPFVHPDAEGVIEPLFRQIQNMPNLRSRPVYICVRSYQSWLEPALENLAAQSSPRQGVMVRHLARRIAQSYGKPALETSTKEPAVPVAH